ncbi:MAG: glycosyltransferase [Methanosarcinaceae archaeon]|nr:glycosyltransferase [Methanosarcinaceae archaeon]
MREYAHPNIWELLEMIRLLNLFGFVVDVIDRSVDDFVPKDIYDLFIGLGSGGSGKYYMKYASLLKRAIKVLYATGADPILSNKLALEQYNRFYERTGIKAPPMRMRDIDFKKFIFLSDYIFCIGEENSFSFSSYKKYNKQIHPIFPSSNPHIKFSLEWLATRRPNRFYCRAGNGFIYKGVDLLVEAFRQTPHLELYISGPDSEPAFFEAYKAVINKAPNISYEGFISMEQFNELCGSCSYSLSASASEGCSTSVTTSMRAGLVPIINYETDD